MDYGNVKYLTLISDIHVQCGKAKYCNRAMAKKHAYLSLLVLSTSGPHIMF